MKYILMGLSLILFSPIAAIADDAGRIDRLTEQLAALSKRVAALERENRQLAGQALSPETARRDGEPSSFARREARPAAIDFDGDFRYRYESLDLQGTTTQTRSRIRARASAEGELGPGFRVGAGLSTGGTSPVSSTQTLGEGGSKKAIALDLAYVDWSPYSGVHLLAGKFRNPLLQVPSQTLLWDDEWRPEGVGVTYDRERFFATVLGTWLDSDSLAPAREFALAAHAGLRQEVGAARLTAGLGYVDVGTAGKGTFFGADTAFAGNTFDCADPADPSSCTYRYDYREVEAFAALDADVHDVATRVYGHYVENLDADGHGGGWTVGARFKAALRDHPVQFDYFYRDVGADAVFGQLTDSDFGGGGADAEGHYLKAGFTVYPKWVLSLTYFRNRVGADAGNERDFDRLQLNADFSY